MSGQSRDEWITPITSQSFPIVPRNRVGRTLATGTISHAPRLRRLRLHPPTGGTLLGAFSATVTRTVSATRCARPESVLGRDAPQGVAAPNRAGSA